MSPAPHEPGVAPSALGLVREAAALGVAALVTRGELAALELTEARERAAPPLLQATLDELKQDCDALRGARRTSP